MSLMVSISGVRGIVGDTLTPDVVALYAGAFAEYCGHGPLMIGRDGRESGAMLAEIAAAAMAGEGRDVVDLGVVPTPTVGLAVEESGAAGGIVVTASHNPAEWNGLKFLGPSGMFLDHRENDRLAGLVRGRAGSATPAGGTGKVRRDGTWIDRHLARIFSAPDLDPDTIRRRNFRVVADCINAAGGAVIPRLLRELGCEVVGINCDISGAFARAPEPLPENLKELGTAVNKEGADVGIAVDPDVDRLVLIDERGQPFGEENTVVTAVHFVLSRRPPDSSAVAVNLSTTRAVDDVARRFGATVYRTPVGEINVAARMKEVGAAIGGEGSGGVIYPSVHYMRDAVAGTVLLLQQLAEFGGTVSQFRDVLPRYTIRKRAFRISGAGDTGEILERFARSFSGEGTLRREDGVKIDFENSWLHLRRSNTEPIIRAIAEAPTAGEAEALIDRIRREFD